MRPFSYFLAIFIALGIVFPTVPFADTATYGREYVENQRELEKAKKQLVRDQRELEEFESLAAALDALPVLGEEAEYKQLSAKVHLAMEREQEQVQELIIKNGTYVPASQPETAPDGEADWVYGMSASQRADRMKRIVGEAGGLQYAISAGELDAVPRFRILVEEFLELMRADVREVEANIRGESSGQP